MSEVLRDKVMALIPPIENDDDRRDFCQYAHDAITKVIQEHALDQLDLTISGLSVLHASAVLRVSKRS